MSDSILERYAGRTPGGDGPSPSEQEAADDLGAFGWLRGVRDRAIMLELRHKNGNCTALSYALLERAEFDPSEGITLRVAGQTVRIKGRNLNSEIRPNVRLFQGILRHRVPWIQEADGATELEAPKNATIIEQITVP